LVATLVSYPKRRTPAITAPVEVITMKRAKRGTAANENSDLAAEDILPSEGRTMLDKMETAPNHRAINPICNTRRRISTEAAKAILHFRELDAG
jgi:hypothetical protein